MDKLNITSAQYLADPLNGGNSSIIIVIDGETLYAPVEAGNRHYAEILRQVEAGTLVIQEADNV
jgi:hypothetical protein